ncbi:sigma-70 region 4 domain-containing protein [Sphingomonas sp. TREG-RG-20F-R18-01]|uniref:sigma-70 region 4 domain-containing protein n=1 Tax=Sphingomonas sp. TREG-RG-20F-R18-01 TaxID=2914982 RepID=UPI001F5AADA5|nr:sigma-70 region 4 domain-containing protein [Sphingomonas sp. TREG-RG-20F-R18-01]
MNDPKDPDLAARSKIAFDCTIASQSGSIEPPAPERIACIERALLALPRITREIFLAHRLDHYSYEKMAKITGLSVRQVERQIAKAVSQIDRYVCGDERTAWQRWRDAHLPRWLR